MADWHTVRHDPTYEEPLDPELVPLLDALNDAGFVTISSCSGHGRDWAHITFAHSTDDCIERLARFVMADESGDYRPYFTRWQKEILCEANVLTHGHQCYWSIQIHPNDVYADTPANIMLEKIRVASDRTAIRVGQFKSVGADSQQAKICKCGHHFAWHVNTLMGAENQRTDCAKCACEKFSAADTATRPDQQAVVERAQLAICHSRDAADGLSCRDKYGIGSWCSACLLHYLAEVAATRPNKNMP